MKIRILLIIIFLPVFVSAQTGIFENFNDNALDPGWNPSSSDYTLTETNQELNATVSKTNNYSNVELIFSSIDISANETASIRVKTGKAFTLRMDLKDGSGNSTNASPITFSIPGDNTYHSYFFDFAGKFMQSFPGSAVVNSSNITSAVIFINPGSSYTGTVYFDDLRIGDSIPLINGNIRVNQIGYESDGPKTAIFESGNSTTDLSGFDLVDINGNIVFSGPAEQIGSVDGWSNRYFWVLDFSSFSQQGTFRVKAGGKTSHPFAIQKNILFATSAFSVVDFFKGMRSTHTSDQSLSFNGPRNDVVNVYGGWWDATGDPGKHLSHLSYANHFNPQQIPLVVWSLLKSYEMNTAGFEAKQAALKEEAGWGADYLLRNLDPNGYFYLSIFDSWGNDPASREICEWGAEGDNAARSENYQCAFREGGGIAIAALAKASLYTVGLGDSTAAQYLRGAEKAYAHLKSTGNGYATKNLEYCNDHTENLIDEYCALLAATELFKATGNSIYLSDAKIRVDNILARLQTSGWVSSDVSGNRPFYHAADEGLPIVALIEYMAVDNSKNSYILDYIQQNIRWYFSISGEVSNPFNYLRQYGKPYDTGLLAPRKAFFIPHLNETGYWWQGENARLASMTTALFLAARKLNPAFQIGADSVSAYALSQLDWILGKNPFDVCMMYGFGVNNYPHYPTAHGLPNITGGICNGITAKDSDENDIEWMPYSSTDWQNWRWIEQWLPHDAWYLLAVSSLSHLNNTTGQQFLSFGGFALSPHASSVEISWSTDYEINTDYFRIERSLNGVDYTVIGTELAKQNSTGISNYSYTDVFEMTGTVYYRLTAVDQNGNIIDAGTRSAIVSSIPNQVAPKPAIFPNPCQDKFKIPGQNFSGTIRIYNATGSLLMQKDVKENTVYLHDIPSGMLIIELISDTDIQVFSVLKSE